MNGTGMMDIRELVAQASLALSGADVNQHSARVSEVPSVRTVRYYAGHGLIDAPLDHVGRRALYGRRHVEQLVAIKRLQSRGLTLVEIQERMLRLSDEELATLADLPAVLSGAATRGPAEEEDEEAFWTREPAVPAAPVSRGAAAPSTEVVGLRLAPGVLVVVEGALRGMDEDDRRALRAAAQPLLRVLQARRIAGDE